VQEEIKFTSYEFGRTTVRGLAQVIIFLQKKCFYCKIEPSLFFSRWC